jgi:enamine deaminase RidA (YjgF/YER057c/UK114 family)
VFLGWAESLLAQAGGTLADIARTWIWMDDILSWYDRMNQERTRLFTERGLLGAAGGMPASTGIGVSPSAGRVAMDFFAARGGEAAVERFHAAGNQQSAYSYGSAFARASRARTPGGVTVFCSGTAAIDADGRTCYAGDIAGQVRMTVENVMAVLADMGCSCNDVVQAMAYCTTPEVRDRFLSDWSGRLPWPCLTMIGDVCRTDLLFEIEVTACPAARKV